MHFFKVCSDSPEINTTARQYARITVPMSDTNEQLGEEIRTVVEQQLQQSELEEVNSAVDRLTEQGHSREKAIDTVGAILLEEIQQMMSENEMFDRDRYISRLEDL